MLHSCGRRSSPLTALFTGVRATAGMEKTAGSATSTPDESIGVEAVEATEAVKARESSRRQELSGMNGTKKAMRRAGCSGPPRE